VSKWYTEWVKEINMPNMSYCRFENTYNDLRDCMSALLSP
jgi:hypothetical protein